MAVKVVVSVGNNGSIITVNRGKNIVKTSYVGDLSSEKNRSDVENLLRQFKKVPIYFILDNVGQNYVKRSFMNVNYFDLQKIAERKFNYEIPKTDLKEKRFMGKNSATNEWEYMFISSPIDDFLQDWINLVESRENILLGIYMLPLETESILKMMEKRLFNKKDNKMGEWCSLLFENRVSGFREMVFCKNKLLFTRILDLESDDREQFVRNFLETKLRTTEYLRRFSKNFDDRKMNIFTITSKEKKEILSTTGDAMVKNYSLREFGAILGEKDIDKYQQDYSDILLQRLIMKNKKIISFSNAEIKSVRTFSSALSLLQVIRNIAVATLPIFIVMLFISLAKTKNELSKAQKTLENETLELEKKRKDEFGENTKNADEITKIASFYYNLKLNQTNPFNFIVKFAENSHDLILVNEFTWNRNEYTKHDFTKRRKSTYNINCVLANKSGKVDDLFKVHDSYSKKIKGAFSSYDVIVSNLPKNINFSTNYYYYPLKMDFMEK
jgi:hypothetical protein